MTRTYNPAGMAKEWQINLIARRDITEELNLHIYPYGAGNEIVSLVLAHADGGVSPVATIDDLSDAHIVIKRMPARAGCALVLKVKKADTLSALSVGKRINKKSVYQRIETGGYVRAQKLGGLTAVAHNRAILLLLLFTAYSAIIMVRLVFIGLFPQGI